MYVYVCVWGGRGWGGGVGGYYSKKKNANISVGKFVIRHMKLLSIVNKASKSWQ